MLLQGENSTYIPEGYYYVKYIALKPSEERAAAIAEAEQTLKEAQEAAVAAQAALTKKGDCTDPICTNGTVCIYCRMDDMVCGAYEPDEETWNALKQSLMEAKQNEAVNDKVAEWRDEYEIRINLTGLAFPE